MLPILKKIFFSVCLVLIISSLYADKKISSEDVRVLSPFFKMLLKYTETGYVLYEKKPVCVVAYSQYPFFFGSFEDSDPFDQVAVATYNAQNILKNSSFHSGNIIFHFDEKDELLLVINRKLFLKTIEENLSLFQYVLGPCINPNSLLQALISPNHGFSELFNYDRVLIGIVLGYGAQNALFNSRLENIENDGVLACDLPPFIPHVMISENTDIQKDFLFLNKNDLAKWEKNRAVLKPSLHFSCLKEEVEQISQKIAISSQQLTSEMPNFIFSCRQEDKALITDLELAQKKIQKLMRSPEYLEKVLEMVFCERVELEKATQKFVLPPVDYNILIAKLLKNELQKYDREILSFFVEGLLIGKNENIRCSRCGASNPDAVNNMRLAKQNLALADDFFMNLEKNAQCKQILKHALYYEVLKEGKGPTLQGERDVLLSFDIYDPKGHCLNSGKQTFALKETCLGFAHGLQGMKVGETRKIYIHPSLAYGVHTYLEKGIYLEAHVVLHEISQEKETLSLLHPVDLSFIRDANFLDKCAQDVGKSLHFRGKKKGEFLRECPGIDVTFVAKAFQALDDQSLLSKEEVNLVNEYFWNLYFNDSH